MACSYQHRDQSLCQFKSRHEYAGRHYCSFHYLGTDQLDALRRELDQYIQSHRNQRMDLRGLRIPEQYGALHFESAEYHEIALEDASIGGDLVFRTSVFGSLDLKGAIVSGNVTFVQNQEIRGHMDLGGARIRGQLSAEATVFQALFSCTGAVVYGHCRLGARFNAGIDASECRFRGGLSIEGDSALIHKVSIFRGARFWKTCSFNVAASVTLDLSHAVILPDLKVHLRDSRRLPIVSFENTRVRKPARISGKFETLIFDPLTRFGKGGDLSNSTITKDVTFCARTSKLTCNPGIFENTFTLKGGCSGEADLRNCSFRGAVLSEGYSFGGGADFTDCVFQKNVDFSGARFHRFAKFGRGQLSEAEAAFKGRANFRGACFDSATFSGREFSDSTDFADCTFGEAPSFERCKLHKETNFPTRFERFPDTESAFAKRRYQTLRLHCEEHGWRIEEGVFHALEERSIRTSKERSPAERGVSYLYDRVSGYGTRFGIPLLWLLFVFALFGVLFAMIEAPPCKCPIDWSALLRGLLTSLRNMFVPFIELRENEDNSNWRDVVRVLAATVESVVSLALIAVVFVAVRWRFRKG